MFVKISNSQDQDIVKALLQAQSEIYTILEAKHR